MRHQIILKMSVVVLGCGILSACATVHPQSAAEPVRVHTDGDAIAMLDTDPYKATHFKIGARWFPRCQQFASLGSRTDIQSACISKEQMQEIVENRIGQQEEFMQRTSVLNGPQGNN